RNMDKLNRAINETAGIIAVYEGEPIQAVYFSTSNGFTENAEDYFQEVVPYLRSVPSPWDKQLSPRYIHTERLEAKQAAAALGLPEAVEASGVIGHIAETTAGQRSMPFRIGGQQFTGRDGREKRGR